MALDTAEARGRVTIRPWRVGVVIDTASAVEVRAAIANLSSVWGGVSMPIFDKKTPVGELEDAGRFFDVDSLYADEGEGPLAELLSKPGWTWRGRAQFGPFGGDEDEGFRTGLLKIRALLGTSAKFVLPEWEEGDPSDLCLAATWGLGDRLEMAYSTIPLDALCQGGAPGGVELGSLGATLTHVKGGRITGRGGPGALHVLQSDRPEDVVGFWNARAYGRPVIAVPANAEADLVRFLMSQRLPITEWSIAGSDAPDRALLVQGFEHASDNVAEIIREVAVREGFSIRAEVPSFPRFLFEGLDTTITRPLRVDFRPDAHWIDIDLPRVPLVEDSQANHFARGMVAAQVELRTVRGQDPRFTTQITPFRRHAALFQHLPFFDIVDRIRPSYEGLVLGLDASGQDVRVPFAYNVDVLRLLFDDESVKVDQSDVGKFQTRAADKFGGPFSGVFSQPGVRKAIMLAAGKAAGVTFSHLREVIEKNRGSWPDAVMESRVTPREYATRALNGLFQSGLFVPTLKIHCSHCRVESFVTADQLGSTMTCEFCGAQFNLALSHGLSQPEWRYRLAAHLRADQVEALLPALATTSMLSQVSHLGEEPVALALGLRVSIGRESIEVDIAAFLPDPEWLAVLGEVKNSNRIDMKDVGNLELLRTKLRSKGVRCLLLFATLKDKFTIEEISALRGVVERSEWVQTARGQMLPDVPLVLTGPDVSHHYWDKDHPWRWERQSHAGIFDTALESCKKNLGLKSFDRNPASSGVELSFVWDDSVLVSTDLGDG
jgi:hypothetical protein